MQIDISFCDFLRYYAQHLSYLLHIVFPFLGILQHYIEFNSCTITRLENLLVVESFNIKIGHLTYLQVTLAFFSWGHLLLMVRFATFAFLGCWVWIVLAQVSFVCCGMITLLFSIWWHMLTSTFSPSIWHWDIQTLLP